MTLRELLKTSEGFIVVFGLFLIIMVGKIFAYITLALYLAVKIPNFNDWIKKMLNKGKDLVDGK